jgi:hypothetical protein
MRAQHPKCKILLFSGQAGTLDLLKEARAQGHDFHLLLKPVHPSELLAEIGTMRDEKAPIKTARTTCMGRPAMARPALLAIARVPQGPIPVSSATSTS